MSMEILKDLELSPNMPHGWKKGVAEALGVHQNTVTKHLKRGNGGTYDRIMQTALMKYGKKKNKSL